MARGKFQGGNDRSHIHQVETGDLDAPVTVDLDNKDPNAFEVVVVDDTPLEDQGKDTTWNGPSSLADQEDDLRNLSKRQFEKRLSRVVAETHTERRAREAAERERDAAIELARNQNTELTRLRQTVETGNTALVGSMRTDREGRIADASRRLEQAMLEGNGAAMAKATADISQANAELVAINTRATPAPQPAVPQPPPVQPQRQQAPSIAPRALAWVQRNTWFDARGSDPKSQDALDINETLARRGVDPNSETYTRELDRRLKALYPDHIPFEQNGDRQERSTPRRTNTVAEGSRESDNPQANPRTVELTASQVAIAKKLGVPLQKYAASTLTYQAKLRGAQ